MRFESIDRDNIILSKNKRSVSYVSLDKAQERNFSHLLNANAICADYQINDKLVTRRTDGLVSLSKQSRRWNEDPYGSVKLKSQFQMQSESGLTSYDSVKAFE